jgi:FkbM family methyltransferase
MVKTFTQLLYYADKSLSDMEASLRATYLTSSGWLESAQTKLPVRDGVPVPWITYSALNFLEREITSEQAVYEFGAGHSSLFWAERVRRVAGVDHDPEFVSYIKATAPANLSVLLAQENDPVSEAQREIAARAPLFPEPVRDLFTYRSGQLNASFIRYALSIFEFQKSDFDIVVIDGMARCLSTWAAIEFFQGPGMIVFDNSDREIYKAGLDLLEHSGYRRIDFAGLGPINPYAWCTSVFYKPARFRGTRWFPVNDQSKLTQEKSKELGILVFGYNRPDHLQSVLESLRLQGRLHTAHIWLDGTQGRGEYQNVNSLSAEIAQRYATAECRIHRSHLGIEKLMLDGLKHMARIYDRILILEDDCFPIEGGIDEIERILQEIEGNDDLFSVYGHPFGTEPEHSRDFSRFQGWGWGVHSQQIEKLIPELESLFLMDERSYVETIAARMTPDIVQRLDCTKGRNVLEVLKSFFSWDSALSFLTAESEMLHRRASRDVILNTGITQGIGHFQKDDAFVRSAPFNMIALDEAWTRFDQTSEPCDYSRESYGLDGLDVMISQSIPIQHGFFVELGAYDGLTQSNSVLLEKAGWRGLLIEANPGRYAKCVRTRPNAIVEHAACVDSHYPDTHTTLCDAGLMSMTDQSDLQDKDKEAWINRARSFIAYEPQNLRVPACTLNHLLEKHKVTHVDLLLLDVEGAELSVLGGLDFKRWSPSYIVAEDPYSDKVECFLRANHYVVERVLLERPHTRDVLYRLGRADISPSQMAPPAS